VANLQLQFVMAALPTARYGKLGNIDRVTVTSSHVDADPPNPPGCSRSTGLTAAVRRGDSPAATTTPSTISRWISRSLF